MNLLPEERYIFDPDFHGLVRILEAYIAKAQYTPTEMREAVILACIHYEMNNTRQFMVPKEAHDAVMRAQVRLHRLEILLKRETEEREAEDRA